MRRVHRALFHRLAQGSGRPASELRVTVIDTPYGFQSNADALTADAVNFFAAQFGVRASVASLRRADDDVLAHEVAAAHIRDADVIFSGPGSPSYAARQWSQGEIPALLVTKLRDGGALVLASAAAMTIGRFVAPVYEIYKAGAEPEWIAGIDLLAEIGLDVAVLTHWNNGEGGDHDTRYCFLGERRLLEIEAKLPAGTSILGIDEHTALLLDIAEARATVWGRGGVTLRRAGESTFMPKGTDLPLEELRARSRVVGQEAEPSTAPVAIERHADTAPPSDAMDLEALARELLALDVTPEMRRRIVALAELAARGQAAEAQLVAPLVEALLEIRRQARARGDWQAADAIRASLTMGGVSLMDGGNGSTTWRLEPRRPVA
jgi:hypothetical protein